VAAKPFFMETSLMRVRVLPDLESTVYFSDR
jgi:hypothetical protein